MTTTAQNHVRQIKVVRFRPRMLREARCPSCETIGSLRSISKSEKKHYLECQRCAERCTGLCDPSVSREYRDRAAVSAQTIDQVACPHCGESGAARRTSWNKTQDECWHVRCSKCDRSYLWRGVRADDADGLPRREVDRAPRMVAAAARPLDADEASLLRDWIRDAKRQLGASALFSDAFEIYDMSAARRLATMGVVSLPKHGEFGARVDLAAARRLVQDYDAARGRM